MTSIHPGWDDFARLNPGEFEVRMRRQAEALVELLCRKRASYGPHNLSKFGDDGVLIRASDKMERLVHMFQQGLDITAVGESYEDAWTDIAGYALLLLLAHSLATEEAA